MGLGWEAGGGQQLGVVLSERRKGEQALNAAGAGHETRRRLGSGQFVWAMECAVVTANVLRVLDAGEIM